VNGFADRSLTVIRSAVVTHPLCRFAPEQMRGNRFRSHVPDVARRIRKSKRLTRWKFIAKDLTLLRRVRGRDDSVLLKNFVSDTIPGTKPILRPKK
jgi:hypothetical protein